MSGFVPPDYHAVVSPLLAARLRGGPAATRSAAGPKRRVGLDRGVHLLRRDGQRPLRLSGTLVATGERTPALKGEGFRQRLNLYLSADSRLVAHVILEPENQDNARPVYTVVEMYDDADVAAIAAHRFKPLDATADEKPKMSEGTNYVLSDAVA